MKQFKNISILFLTLSIYVFAQTSPTFSGKAPQSLSAEQEKALNDIADLNGKVLELYGKDKFDNAIKLGLQAVGIAQNNALTEDLRAMPAFTNLAEAYMARGKPVDAIPLFLAANKVYEKEKVFELQGIMFRRLGLAYERKGEFESAIDYHLKDVALEEKHFGVESDKYIDSITLLANTYAAAKKFDLAEELYQKAITIKRDSIKADGNQLVLDSYLCFVYRRTGSKLFSRKSLRDVLDNEFYKKYEAFLKSIGLAEPHTKDILIDPSVEHGMAVRLVTPSYPPIARYNKISGMAIVQIAIDENGYVTAARMMCGPPELRTITELAARRSLFSTTKLDGKPVKVSGQILYDFKN